MEFIFFFSYEPIAKKMTLYYNYQASRFDKKLKVRCCQIFCMYRLYLSLFSFTRKFIAALMSRSFGMTKPLNSPVLDTAKRYRRNTEIRSYIMLRYSLNY